MSSAELVLTAGYYERTSKHCLVLCKNEEEALILFPERLKDGSHKVYKRDLKDIELDDLAKDLSWKNGCEFGSFWKDLDGNVCLCIAREEGKMGVIFDLTDIPLQMNEVWNSSDIRDLVKVEYVNLSEDVMYALTYDEARESIGYLVYKHYALHGEKEEQEEQQEQKKVTSMGQGKKSFVDANKEAAIIAAKLELGRTVIDRAVKLLEKVGVDQAFVKSPLGPIAVANALRLVQANVDVLEQDALAVVVDAAMLAGADHAIQSLQLRKIANEMFEGLTIPKILKKSDV